MTEIISPLKFYILATIYYTTQIINLYIGIEYFRMGYLAYFIIYLVLLAFEKYCAFMVVHVTKESYTIWLLDFLFLGFLNKFDSSKQVFIILMNWKIMIILYPMLIMQTFMKIDINETSFSSFTALVYYNYLAQIFLVSNFYIHYLCDKDSHKAVKSFFGHLAYFLSIKYMLSQYDYFGINLGYYCLLVSVVNIIIFIFKYPKYAGEYYLGNFLLFGACNVMNYNLMLSVKKQDPLTKDYLIFLCRILNFFNQCFRLLIILIFLGVAESNKSFLQFNYFYQLNLFLAIVSSLLFFLIQSKKIFKYTLCQKYLIIESKKDFEAASDQLQIMSKYLKTINIHIFLSTPIVCTPPLIYNEPLLLSQEKSCYYYKFQKGYSLQASKNVKLNIENYGIPFKCDCSVKYAISQFEKLYAVHTDKFSTSELTQMIQQRIQHGFIHTELTLELFSQLHNKNSNKNQNFACQYLASLIIQFNAIYKIIYPEMVMQPQLITYDLFDI